MGGVSSPIEAGKAVEELKALREEAGPYPWWTVPDGKLEELCLEFFHGVGGLESALANRGYSGMVIHADNLSETLFLSRTAIAKRMEELTTDVGSIGSKE